MSNWKATAIPILSCICAGALGACNASGSNDPTEDATDDSDSADWSPDFVGDGPRDAIDGPGDGWEAPEGCLGLSAPCEDFDECCSGICYRGYCSTETGTCEDPGTECISPAECCSGKCEEEEDEVRRCQDAATCTALDEPCDVAADCCSLSCPDGFCSADSLCVVVGQECSEASECCSNNCDGTNCLSTTEPCLPLGEACGGEDRCCSDQCETASDETLRCTGNYACRPSGEICLDDDDCCTWKCEDGHCAELVNCAVVGIPCEGLRECCSGACAESGVGTETCQYLSGCRPIGELCIDPSDCCSGDCSPSVDYEDVLRCRHPEGCLLPGEVCGTGSAFNCCDGHDRCRVTLAGVMRCYSVDDGSCISDGDACSFSDECCCGLCAADDSGDPVCCPDGITCVPDGGACTSDADCCDLKCTNGVCSPGGDCVPLAGPCDSDDDCCSGGCDEAAGSCVVIVI